MRTIDQRKRCAGTGDVRQADSVTKDSTKAVLRILGRKTL